MALILRHHPRSRAATVVWMLEELGLPYELQHVDLMKGEQKSTQHKALNLMGKVPVLVDGEVVISESAAIAVYLADRYAPGRLAPALDDPRRGAFLRWCFYAPSVVEPCCMAKAAGWAYSPSTAGFGSYEEMVETLEGAIGAGPWLLGEAFTMADVVLGGTIRWMLLFGMLDKREAFVAYTARLAERPAFQRAEAKNKAIASQA